MTVTVYRSPLDYALEIPGARAVALLDAGAGAGATVLWWAGDSSLGEREAAVAVAVAVAAAGLVALADPGDELGDVLVTSVAAFHVLRLVGDGAQVAHLMLRRAGANLAMARQEFKQLTDAHRRHSRHATGIAPAPAPQRSTAEPPVGQLPEPSVGQPPGPSAGRPPMPELDLRQLAISQPSVGQPPMSQPEDLRQLAIPQPDMRHPPGPPPALAALPRRRPHGPPIDANGAPPAGETGALVPGWLTMLGHAYLTDEGVLDRILVTLRHL